MTAGEPFLFVSFDLANATAFKYSHPKWITLFYGLMEYLKDGIRRYPKWEFWKTNGDEILFYCTGFQKKEVDGLIQSVDELMKTCLLEFYKDHSEIDFIKQLAIRATTWMANVASYDAQEGLRQQSADYKVCFSGRVDFVGRETDIGFRIGKYAPRSKTSLNAALLYYLIKNDSKIIENIRIVDYVQLKGVWNDKRYPIIWYLRSRNPTDIVRSFHYDERYENTCIEALITNLQKDENYGQVEKREFENLLDYLGLTKEYDLGFRFGAS